MLSADLSKDLLTDPLIERIDTPTAPIDAPSKGTSAQPYESLQPLSVDKALEVDLLDSSEDELTTSCWFSEDLALQSLDFDSRDSAFKENLAEEPAPELAMASDVAIAHRSPEDTLVDAGNESPNLEQIEPHWAISDGALGAQTARSEMVSKGPSRTPITDGLPLDFIEQQTVMTSVSITVPLPRGPPPVETDCFDSEIADVNENTVQTSLPSLPEGMGVESIANREASSVYRSYGPVPDFVPVFDELRVEFVPPVFQTAVSLWQTFGLDPLRASVLRGLRVQISDLPDGQLGWADPDAITLDSNAAGYGWYVDSTPSEHSEFTSTDSRLRLPAEPQGLASGRIDLLTVLLHELGHVLGYEHDSGLAVMSAALAAGERVLVGSNDPTETVPPNASPVSGPLTVVDGNRLVGEADDNDLIFRIYNSNSNGLFDVEVTGSNGDDGTYLDITSIAGVPLGLNDTIVLDIDQSAFWDLTGIGSGTLSMGGFQPLAFSLVENLTGAATAKDTFKLSDGSMIGNITDRAGVLEVQIEDFLVLGGDADFSRVTQSVSLDNGVQVSNARVLKLGLTSGNFFAGSNYGQPSEQGYKASNINLGLAIITDVPGGKTWVALTGTASGISTIGFDKFSLSASDLSVSVNTSSGGRVVDFNAGGSQSGGTPMSIPAGPTINFDGDSGRLLQVSGTINSLNLYDLVFGTASLTLTSRLVDVSFNGTTLSLDNASLLSFGLSDLDIYAGTSGTGVRITGGTIALGVIKPAKPAAPATDDRTYVGIQANFATATLVGVPRVALNLSD
ncbi:MAG: hypothetical protein ACKOAU_18505, partial [Pirellula sp.]